MRVTVYIPDTLGKEIEQLATSQGISVSSLYAEAVENHLQTLKREEAFQKIEQLVGTQVAPDFDRHLTELRRDDPER